MWVMWGSQASFRPGKIVFAARTCFVDQLPNILLATVVAFLLEVTFCDVTLVYLNAMTDAEMKAQILGTVMDLSGDQCRCLLMNSPKVLAMFVLCRSVSKDALEDTPRRK
jgi:hypothetical protein